nr:DUF397 domain-containing protein [Nocardia nova]
MHDSPRDRLGQRVWWVGKDCVEVAHLTEGTVAVRDSKNPTGPALLFTPGEWDAFTAGIQDGKFQRPA